MANQRRAWRLRIPGARAKVAPSKAAVYRQVDRMREDFRLGMTGISEVSVWVREPGETRFELYERLDFPAEVEG